MIIGICGKSGSGKSTLAKEITNYYIKDAVHLDIDKVGHKVLTYKEVQEELINSFGPSIITNKNVDRKKLGKIVFTSREEMNKLTEITWKHMQIEIDYFLEDNKNKLIILDWLLLPLSKYFEKCEFKILVDIPYELRKERAIKRDNITSEAFDLREQASIDYDASKFDYIVKSDLDIKKLRRFIKQI